VGTLTRLAMAAPLTITNITTLLAKSEGRDKVGRFCQYGCRMIVGLASLQTLKADTPLYLLHERAGNVMKQLASARRVHRWCKEFPVIQAIIASLPTEVPRQICVRDVCWKTVELMQKVTLATFMICDHVGWLKQVKILKGGKRAGTGTIQLGLKFFGVANFLAAVLAVRTAQNEGDQAKRGKAIKTWFKHLLLCGQCAHLSRTYESHDAFVGVLGMITSGMDVQAQWPEAKK